MDMLKDLFFNSLAFDCNFIKIIKLSILIMNNQNQLKQLTKQEVQKIQQKLVKKQVLNNYINTILENLNKQPIIYLLQSSMSMISQQLNSTLITLAQQFVLHLKPSLQTTALIINEQSKYDRIDSKLMKEADKLNKKERLSVKRQYKDRQRVGAITYKSYTIQYKKNLVARIRQTLQSSNESLSKLIRTIAKDQKIHPKNLTRWYHTKELKKKQGGRRALYPQMEIRLANFIMNNPTMKRKHILRQAKQIMEDLQIPDRNEFNFSKGWYERFKERLTKNKVTKGAKLQDILKIEAKQQGYSDIIKKEQYKEEYFSDNEECEEYYGSEQDQDEKVKFEQYMNESNQTNKDFGNVNLSQLSDDEDTQTNNTKEPSIYDSEQEDNEVKQEEQKSTDMLIKEQREKINRTSKIIRA